MDSYACGIKYKLRNFSNYVIFTFSTINLFLSDSGTPLFYTTNIGIYRLLHDIAKFFVLFLRQLFFKFTSG